MKRLVADGEPVDEVGKWGYTPLHAAAHLGHNEIVKFLIDNGADINRNDNERKETPLQVAKTNEVTETLLAAGANPISIANEQDAVGAGLVKNPATGKLVPDTGDLSFTKTDMPLNEAQYTQNATSAQQGANAAKQLMEQTFDAFANMDFSPNLGSLESIFGNTATNQNTLTAESQVNTAAALNAAPTAEALNAPEVAQPAPAGQLSRKEIDDVMDMGKGDVKYDKDAVKVVEDMMRANGLEVKNDGKVSRGERDALESFLQKSGTQQQLDALRAAFEAAGGRGGDDAKAGEPKATTYNVNPIDGTSMSVV